MTKKYLVDVNLPKFFKFFNSDAFVHVCDINPKLSDTEIWNYALANNLIILSRDVDFYTRILVATKKCKVIYFNLGNIKINELHSYFNDNWNLLEKEIENCFLIVAERGLIKVVF